ncbi:DUF2993 domain-containing protein [Georgenia sp. AZ-5]|uniref:LmeA family phospholipid-binding protein n=1 Tax=Georgenia sp. AZ-5 TaxID=3367526 RepID=UPI003754150A
MRAARTLIVVVLVVLVLAVVADRAANAWAEREVGNRLAEAAGTEGRPAVSIEGFPFLTQVLAGEIGAATATAEAAQLEGVRLRDLDARAAGVGLTSPVTVESLELVGTLPEDELQRLVDEAGLGLAVATGPDGLSLSGELLGQTVEVGTTPVVERGEVGLAVETVELAGLTVDPGRVAPLLGMPELMVDIDLPALPYGLRITDAVPGEGGVRVTASGADVILEEAG